MDFFKRLPESELDIMLAVWTAEGEISAPEILSALDRPLTASALHSYLKRLEEKGFLSCRKEGKTNLYTPSSPRPAIRRRRERPFWASSTPALSAALPPLSTTAAACARRMWPS